MQIYGVSMLLAIIMCLNMADCQKRAPPSGFNGMRGKKSFPDDVFIDSNLIDEGNSYQDDHQQQMTRTTRFVPSRGRKDLDLDDNDLDKRAPNGFMGMRGKKEYESFIDDVATKRAPKSGFFGMRGKKQRSGFFGMRGKKYPYEFRGKFVGVRGKKLSKDLLPADYYGDVSKIGDGLDINQLMLLLTENEAVAENSASQDYNN